MSTSKNNKRITGKNVYKKNVSFIPEDFNYINEFANNHTKGNWSWAVGVAIELLRDRNCLVDGKKETPTLGSLIDYIGSYINVDECIECVILACDNSQLKEVGFIRDVSLLSDKVVDIFLSESDVGVALRSMCVSTFQGLCIRYFENLYHHAMSYKAFVFQRDFIQSRINSSSDEIEKKELLYQINFISGYIDLMSGFATKNLYYALLNSNGLRFLVFLMSIGKIETPKFKFDNARAHIQDALRDMNSAYWGN